MHARRWFLLGVLSLTLVLVVMSVSGLNVALATLQRDVGVTGPQLQWIVNAYALAFGGLLMTGGAIGDRYGRKGALLGGLLVFGLGALLGGLADSAEVILVARAAMGVAAAFVMPATLSLLIEIFPPPERPTAIAIWSGFAGGGAAIGPLLTGLFVTGWWFVPSWGWEAGFLYNVPLVAVVMVAMALWLPRSRDERSRHLDPARGRALHRRYDRADLRHHRGARAGLDVGAGAVGLRGGGHLRRGPAEVAAAGPPSDAAAGAVR